MKTHKLGSAPITDTEYAELLGNIGKLSEKDKKALRARARAYELPAALSVAENALRAVFRRLFDLAWSLGQADRSLYQRRTDRSRRANGRSLERARRAAQCASAIELCGTAEVGKGGVRFRELEPNAGLKAIEILMPSVTPDVWMSDVFIKITLLMGRSPVTRRCSRPKPASLG